MKIEQGGLGNAVRKMCVSFINAWNISKHNRTLESKIKARQHDHNEKQTGNESLKLRVCKDAGIDLKK